MKLLYFFTTLLLSVGYLYSQPESMIDYYRSCNALSQSEVRTLKSVWMFNGRLVEMGAGYIICEKDKNDRDSIPFVYSSGSLMFEKNVFEKLCMYESFCDNKEQRLFYDNMGKNVEIVMFCFILSNGEYEINQVNGLFPFNWVVNCLYSDILWSSVYRITFFSNDEYVVSAGTYGYYLSYANSDKKHMDKKAKRRILKQHMKYYGRY